MKTQILKTLFVGVVACCSTLTTYAKDDHLSISYLGNGQSFVRPMKMQKYLLLPVEEKAGEARLSLIANNQTVQTITVRLAVNQVDYYVPFELNGYDKDQIVLDVHGVKDDVTVVVS